jgi:hypothetical protein
MSPPASPVLTVPAGSSQTFFQTAFARALDQQTHYDEGVLLDDQYCVVIPRHKRVHLVHDRIADKHLLRESELSLSVMADRPRKRRDPRDRKQSGLKWDVFKVSPYVTQPAGCQPGFGRGEIDPNLI